MTTPRRGIRAGDRGSVSIFFVVAAVALLLTVGLVVDGAGRIRALQQADAVAAEAARQGGQAIDTPQVVAARSVGTSTAQARAAAAAYLAAARVQGTVTVTGGTHLRVDTTTTYTPVFLSLVGVGPMTTRGHAEARLTRALDGERP